MILQRRSDKRSWRQISLRFAVLAAALLSACSLFKVSPDGSDPCPTGDSVYVPAGWFLMGQDDGRASNQPQHRVYLDAYCLQRTEVTEQAYAELLADRGESPPAGTGIPARAVLWEEADAYCRWLGMRLPTEAEWEKAARGQDGRRYPWGAEWDPQKANTAESGIGDVLPVGSFPAGASPYGALDMCGNLSEWVSDRFAFEYYTFSPSFNPTGPEQVLDHGLRGGSYDSPPEWATTYFRDSSHSARPNLRVGFRCAYSPVVTQEP